MAIEIGMTGRAECSVTEQNTALAVGSGALPVFATPMMAALMEAAAMNAVSACLEEGQGTVGTKLDITHDTATPVGMKVWAEAIVTAVDGRRICFTVKAQDACGPIGSGTHERFVISNDRFLARTNQKREASHVN